MHKIEVIHRVIHRLIHRLILIEKQKIPEDLKAS
jgi:hypothetical protein